MKRTLLSDWVKMRKTWIQILVILGPFGVISLTAVRYSLNFHNIVRPDSNAFNWALLIQNTTHLLMPSLVLGIALLASLMTGLEHQARAWKQLLSLPVSRWRIYASKFIWVAVLLAVSATLCVIGIFGLGFAFGFTTHIPWVKVLEECYYPYLASFGIIAVQVLVSVLIANQSFAITLGVFGVIADVLADALSPEGLLHAVHWGPYFPWVYPSLSAHTFDMVQYPDVHFVIYGLVLGTLLLFLGICLFAKKDVK